MCINYYIWTHLKLRYISIEGETTNRYELVVTQEENVYTKTYYKHQPWNVQIDETLAKVKVPKLEIISWTLIEEQQLTKLNENHRWWGKTIDGEGEFSITTIKGARIVGTS